MGVCTPNGVVLGVEKRVQSSLLESSSIEKVVEIDRHLGCAMSGSSITLVTNVILTCLARSHRWCPIYGGPYASHFAESCIHIWRTDQSGKCHTSRMRPRSALWRKRRRWRRIDGRLCSLHCHLTYLQSRPFGVALLIGGVDELGPQLYAQLEFSAFFLIISGSIPTLRVLSWSIKPRQ